jgi:hypothetical protein
MDSILLCGLTPDGSVFLANDGLTNIPNWTAVTEGFKQISGSSGQLVGIDSGNIAHYGNLLSGAFNNYKWTVLDGTVTQVSFDFPMMAGINESNKLMYITDVTKSTLFARGYEGNTYTYISIKGSAAYAIGTDNSLYYTPNFIESTWVNVTGTIAGKTFLQVAFDGSDVAVLDSTNTVFYADTNMTTSPNWRELKGVSMKQISLSNHMIYGVGINNTIYFSLSQTPTAAWTMISESRQMKNVICFNSKPSTMETVRIADTLPCKDGYTRADGGCYSKCPEGYIENGSNCNGVPVLRSTRPTNEIYPVLYTCSPGYEVYLVPYATCNKAGSGEVSEHIPIKEVYRIRGTFSEEDALKKCESYGGALASVEQIAEAHMTDSAYMYPATCYGVKPPEAQFTDIEYFKKGQWNKEKQCPLGYYLHTNSDNCYSVCPTNTIPKEGACAFPDGVTQNIIRTFKPPFKVEKKIAICDTGENLINEKCVKMCKEDEISDSMNCTPKPISRTRYEEGDSYTCGSNEILYKGVCVSNCPAGTKKIEQSCIEGFQASSCTKTTFGSYNKWLCDNQALATEMLDSNPDKNDQICIADDPTTGMYFCESVNDILKNTGFINQVRTDYSFSCDRFMKTYTDLSNNLTNIVNMQSGMTNATTQLGNALVTLKQIYDGISCDENAVNKCYNNPGDSVCNDSNVRRCVEIKKASDEVKLDNDTINASLNSIKPNVTNITNERTSLVELLNNYKCNTPWK